MVIHVLYNILSLAINIIKSGLLHHDATNYLFVWYFQTCYYVYVVYKSIFLIVLRKSWSDNSDNNKNYQNFISVTSASCDPISSL